MGVPQETQRANLRLVLDESEKIFNEFSKNFP